MIKPTQNFITILNPIYNPKSKIQLSPESQKKLVEESLDKLKRVKVLSVGPNCTIAKEGMEVYIPETRLVSSPALLHGEISVFIVRESEILAIYDTVKEPNQLIID